MADTEVHVQRAPEELSTDEVQAAINEATGDKASEREDTIDDLQQTAENLRQSSSEKIDKIKNTSASAETLITQWALVTKKLDERAEVDSTDAEDTQEILNKTETESDDKTAQDSTDESEADREESDGSVAQDVESLQEKKATMEDGLDEIQSHLESYVEGLIALSDTAKSATDNIEKLGTDIDGEQRIKSVFEGQADVINEQMIGYLSGILGADSDSLEGAGLGDEGAWEIFKNDVILNAGSAIGPSVLNGISEEIFGKTVVEFMSNLGLVSADIVPVFSASQLNSMLLGLIVTAGILAAGAVWKAYLTDRGSDDKDERGGGKDPYNGGSQ